MALKNKEAADISRSVTRENVIVPYGLALLLLIAVSAITVLLVHGVGYKTPFLLFFAVVLLAARFWGTGPAILSSVIGGIVAFYFFYNAGTETNLMLSLLQLSIFLAECILVIWLTIKVDKANIYFKENAEQFKLFLEKSADGFSLMDAKGKTLFVSKSIEKILGYTAEELNALPDSELRNEDEAVLLRGYYESILKKDGASVKFTHRYKHKNGNWVWLEVSLTNHMNDPSIKAIIGNFRDVTKRVVEEKQKDDFISILSQELRTNLYHLKMYAEVVKQESEKENNVRIENIVERMALQISRTNKLVEDLNDVALIRDSRFTYGYSFFDFNDLVIDVVGEINTTNKTHTINTHLATIERVLADKERIAQVLRILISNAIKYSPESKMIKVSSQPFKNYLKLEVTDTGLGINKAEHQMVFDRFYRSSDNPLSGIGLGLHLAKQIIDEHGGAIGFESEVSKGSTFWFTLPLT